MEWLNEGAGLIALISLIVTIVLSLITIIILVGLRKRIAQQRLNFLGFFSTDVESRKNYAELTVGNKSLNELAVTELGIRNGRVNFDLTALYRKKNGILPETRIVVEQRSSIRFTMTEEELWQVLIDGKKGKELKKLRLYAVDLTGTLYKGKISAVRKLLHESMLRAKRGEPQAVAPVPPVAPVPFVEPIPPVEPIAPPDPVPPVEFAPPAEAVPAEVAEAQPVPVEETKEEGRE